jgi:hypothetical protein
MGGWFPWHEVSFFSSPFPRRLASVLILLGLRLLLNHLLARALLFPLFTGVRGRGILRTSPFPRSRKPAKGQDPYLPKTGPGYPSGCPGPMPPGQSALAFVDDGGRHPTVPHSPPGSYNSPSRLLANHKPLNVKNHSFAVYTLFLLGARILCL